MKAQAIAFLLWGAAAFAEDYSFTNAQLLYGGEFRDFYYDISTADGQMTTVAIEHYGTWKYGDNYFLVNLYQGDFVNFDGEIEDNSTRAFAKWVSRLSVARMTSQPESRLSSGGLTNWLKDAFVSGRIDRTGNGFFANLFGAGVELDLPSPLVVGADFYVRNDRFNSATWQVSPYWTLPFEIGKVPLVFTGYVDLSGTDRLGLDVYAGPHLLLDIGAISFSSRNKLLIGATLTYHNNDSVTTQALQGEVRWVW